jgi:type IV secretory pathway VirB4 component
MMPPDEGVEAETVAEVKDEKYKSALEKDNERLKKRHTKRKKEKEKRKVPKSTIDTIPYLKMCQDNITMLEKGLYSKTFEFTDINYSIMKQEEQEDIFIIYGKLLNYFSSDVGIQINIINSVIDINEVQEKIFYKFGPDEKQNRFKEEYNNILRNFVSKREIKIVRKKYITLTLKRESFDTARVEFNTLENALNRNFKLLGSSIRAISNKDKVKLLKGIFRGVDINLPEFTQKDFNKQVEKNFIAPDYFSFKPKYFMFGDKFAKTLILRNLPAYLSDSLIIQLSELDSALNISININSVMPAIASKIINRKLTAIESDKIKYVRHAIKNNMPTDILPRDLQFSLDEAREILSDMLTKNEKMFLANILVTAFDDSFEGLTQKVDVIKNIASQNVCQFGELVLQQEPGMVSTLPIGFNKIDIKRTLTTNSTSIFLPFNTQSLNMGKGIFYGINPRSNEIIYADRKKLMNANGFILGTSGSGKSVSAKDEMTQIFWKYPDDNIIIIDPEGEFVRIAEAYGGESLKISSDSTNYVNPLDISYISESKINPLALKIDFMITLAEVCCGGEISAIERSLIDRAMNLVYGKYFISKNSDDIPTLVDFYNILKKEGDVGLYLATKLEIYCVGSQNLFAHKTNVDIKNRFFVYNIKELNPTLKALGMLIMLDNIISRITINSESKKFTWLFMDEMHVLLKYNQSAAFLENIFKIARKWGVIPTGITQNLSDLLQSEHGRKMLGNAEYIRLLRQKSGDRAQIAELLEISDNQLDYLNNPAVGSGLIVWGDAIVPFKTDIPEGSALMELWGTSNRGQQS